MIRKSIAPVILATLIALAAVGCGSTSNQASSSTASLSPSQESTSSSSASAASSTASKESTKSETSQATTVFGSPQIVNLKSGSGVIIGTSANFHAAKADCTEENLASWYNAYVKDSTDNWCVILFDDDPRHGVYAKAPYIYFDTGLEKDSDGSYSVISSDDEIIYSADSNGNLTVIQ